MLTEKSWRGGGGGPALVEEAARVAGVVGWFVLGDGVGEPVGVKGADWVGPAPGGAGVAAAGDVTMAASGRVGWEPTRVAPAMTTRMMTPAVWDRPGLSCPAWMTLDTAGMRVTAAVADCTRPTAPRRSRPGRDPGRVLGPPRCWLVARDCRRGVLLAGAVAAPAASRAAGPMPASAAALSAALVAVGVVGVRDRHAVSIPAGFVRGADRRWSAGACSQRRRASGAAARGRARYCAIRWLTGFLAVVSVMNIG